MSRQHPIRPTQGDASDSHSSFSFNHDIPTPVKALIAMGLLFIFGVVCFLVSRVAQDAGNVWRAHSLYRDRLQATESTAHFQARQREHVLHRGLAIDLDKHDKELLWADYMPERNELEIDLPLGNEPLIPIGKFFDQAEIQPVNVVGAQPSWKGLVKLPEQANAVDFLKTLSWKITFVPVAKDRVSTTREHGKITVMVQLQRFELVTANGDALWSQTFAPDRASSLACAVPEESAWEPSSAPGLFRWVVVSKSMQGDALSRKMTSRQGERHYINQITLSNQNWSDSKVRFVMDASGSRDRILFEYDCKTSKLVVDGTPYVRTFDKKLLTNLLLL